MIIEEIYRSLRVFMTIMVQEILQIRENNIVIRKSLSNSNSLLNRIFQARLVPMLAQVLIRSVVFVFVLKTLEEGCVSTVICHSVLYRLC